MSEPTGLVKYKRSSIDVTESMHDSWWYPAAEVEAVLKRIEWLEEGEKLLRREVFGYVNGSWGSSNPKKYLREQIDKWLAKARQEVQP